MLYCIDILKELFFFQNFPLSDFLINLLVSVYRTNLIPEVSRLQITAFNNAHPSCCVCSFCSGICTEWFWCFFCVVMTEDASNFNLSILHLGNRHAPSVKTLCTLSEKWRPVSYHHFISWNMKQSKSKQLHNLYQVEGTRGSSVHSRTE